jgi:hypothetical protein
MAVSGTATRGANISVYPRVGFRSGKIRLIKTGKGIKLPKEN